MEKEKEGRKIMEPIASRLIESLRDTGYTFPTAIADIVDNCVSAKASDIRINLELEFGLNPVFMIVDNGTGMSEEELEKAMTYGAPARPNPKSLGKFGMGLKTASTAFCRKLTVITRKDHVLSLRQWDLDLVASENKWILLTPDQDRFKEQIALLNEVAKDGSGTLVIWDNIDRLVRSNSEGTNAKNQIEKIVEDLKEHLSGVFYNFLKPGGGFPDISIIINDLPLEPWDPFCRWLNETSTRVEMHPNQIQLTNEVNGKREVIANIQVNVYILPMSTELTTEELDKMRYGLNNQGFHIFREGRMISSGGWHRLFVKDPHLNLIRVELLFDHELDDYFQIDIKKSRIDFPKDLRDQLKKLIAPARHEANKRYRVGRKGRSGSGLTDQHNKAGNVINKHHDEATADSRVETVNPENGETQIRNRYGTTKIRLVYDNTHDCVVQAKPTLEDGVLWAPGLVEGNKHAVFLNEAHDFYHKFYTANKDNATLILAMDSILWSLAEAELSVMSDNVKRNLESLRINVSKSLRILAEELPEVKEFETTEAESEQE